MHPIIHDLTFLHRQPLNLGKTARERGVIATPNRLLDSYELAMKGEIESDPPVRICHVTLMICLLALLIAVLLLH